MCDTGIRQSKGRIQKKIQLKESLSDDDEMPQPSRRRSKINSAVTSEADSEERSLLAMMDIDDGEFISEGINSFCETENEIGNR